MDLGIAGKVALVMGGSKGVGRAAAGLLAAEGCKVAVIARDGMAVEKAVLEITERGGEATGIAADMTHEDSVADAVDRVRRAFGSPDIAIYNGVTPRAGGFDDVAERDFVESYRMTVLGFAALVRSVAPAMKEKRWGRIVTVGSRTVKQPLRRDELPYVLANTTRVAAVGLSKTLADELGPFGITVNTIGTGRIATESYDSWTTEHSRAVGSAADDFLDDKLRRIPLRRFGRPEEMAALIAFLCSQGGGFVTGETINCDGGRNEALF
jgi:3-oxoacyl-[acyl-carrier protein] reductase